MKKVIRLTEKDLTRIVKRVVKENEEDMGHRPSILDDIDDEVAELSNDEVGDYLLSIIAHCEKIMQNFDEYSDEDEYGDEEDF